MIVIFKNEFTGKWMVVVKGSERDIIEEFEDEEKAIEWVWCFRWIMGGRGDQ